MSLPSSTLVWKSVWLLVYVEIKCYLSDLFCRSNLILIHMVIVESCSGVFRNTVTPKHDHHMMIILCWSHLNLFFPPHNDTAKDNPKPLTPTLDWSPPVLNSADWTAELSTGVVSIYGAYLALKLTHELAWTADRVQRQGCIKALGGGLRKCEFQFWRQALRFLRRKAGLELELPETILNALDRISENTTSLELGYLKMAGETYADGDWKDVQCKWFNT